MSTYGYDSGNLGTTTFYGHGGSILDEYVLPIAGKAADERRPYIGPWNFFSAAREGERNRAIPSSCTSTGKKDSTCDPEKLLTPRKDSKTRAGQRLSSGSVTTQSNSSYVSYAERLEAKKAKASPQHQVSLRPPFY